MEIFPALADVFASPALLAAIVLAALVGIVVGALPGLTAAAAIAMLLPVTYHMEPLFALAFLYVIGKSSRYGGSVAAILFNTPGTAASAATQIDGHPLAKQGKAGKTMKAAVAASVVGDFMGDMMLIFGIGFIAALALKLGPPETFAIYLAAFLVVGTVIGESVLKGLASALLGVLIAMVGIDPISATERYAFGSLELSNGIGLVPLLIGVFVFGEVLAQAVSPPSAAEMARADDAEGRRLRWGEFRPCLPHIFRGGFIGAGIGILPGVGSAIAAFVSYAEGKQRASNAEQWGKGALEGVAAPESANNAVSGPSMAPLLTLGIPGSTIGAILLGVFLIHGIQVGPTLFLTSKDLVYQLFACGLLGIAAYGLIGYFGAAHVGALIARVPPRALYPIVFLVSFIAAYTTRSSMFDVLVMIVAGALGYVMRRFGYNAAAFIIAFVLAKGAEESLRQALLLSDGGALIFIQRPIALGFLCLGTGVAVFRSARMLKKRGAATTG